MDCLLQKTYRTKATGTLFSKKPLTIKGQLISPIDKNSIFGLFKVEKKR